MENKTCCFCDGPVSIIATKYGNTKRMDTANGGRHTITYDYCKKCGDHYSKLLGRDFYRSAWFQETVRMSRRAQYLDKKTQTVSLYAPECESLESLPDEPSPLTTVELIDAAIGLNPEYGRLRLHRYLNERGVKVSLHQCQRRIMEKRDGSSLVPLSMS